jgi:DNA-binding NarL/FixJ family response regulator
MSGVELGLAFLSRVAMAIGPRPMFVAAVLTAGSEKAAASRLGLSHSTVKHHLANARLKVGAETTAQLVWILGPRLPEPDRLPDSTEEQLPGGR